MFLASGSVKLPLSQGCIMNSWQCSVTPVICWPRGLITFQSENVVSLGVFSTFGSLFRN